jgi:hypothetical protein
MHFGVTQKLQGKDAETEKRETRETREELKRSILFINATAESTQGRGTAPHFNNGADNEEPLPKGRVRMTAVIGGSATVDRIIWPLYAGSQATYF